MLIDLANRPWQLQAAAGCRQAAPMLATWRSCPPRIPVDLDDLADMLSAVVDGGIILSKVLHDKDALPRQIMLYRDFVRVVFLGV